MTFIRWNDLEPREIVKRHAMRRGGSRSRSWMSSDCYEGFVEQLRGSPPDLTSATGQRGYRITVNHVPMIAAWSVEHDCIVTFLPDPHPNWLPAVGETAFGEKLKDALAQKRRTP